MSASRSFTNRTSSAEAVPFLIRARAARAACAYEMLSSVMIVAPFPNGWRSLNSLLLTLSHPPCCLYCWPGHLLDHRLLLALRLDLRNFLGRANHVREAEPDRGARQ